MATQILPPLTGILQRNADYYQMQWLSDGYPGQRRESQVWAHPIYGAYALKDYLQQWEHAPSEELQTALRTVAAAVLARMEPHEDGLVFWYEESLDSARAVERHYSALTQGYYAIYLARAGVVVNDPALLEAADRVFASLTVPVERGGVYSPGQEGPVLAEISQQPNSHILNGWQSALTAVMEYAEVSGRAEARDLAHASAREMARLLPLYDAPALRNSRYGLTGFVYARLVFRGAEDGTVTLRDLGVGIPGEGELAVDRIGGRRWQNHLLPQDVSRSEDDHEYRVNGNVVRLNVVLSRVGFPVPNRLRAHVQSPGGVVDVQLQCGRYDPLTVSQADKTWTTVARVDCPAGPSWLDVALPWDVADLVAYPTNFAKKIDGNQTNIYHWRHISRLYHLAKGTGIPELAEWGDTWQRYVGQWHSMSVYEGLYIGIGDRVTPIHNDARTLPKRSPAPVDSRSG